MADHSRVFGSGLPVTTDIVGVYTTDIDGFKDDASQRLTLDHYLDGVLTEGAANQDGRHRQVTMKELSGDPTYIANTGIVYTKDVDGITELHYEDDTGQVIQITDDGKVFQSEFMVSISSYIDSVASVSGTAGTAAAQTSFAETTVSYPTVAWTKLNTVILSSQIEDSSGNKRECANFYRRYSAGYYGVEVLFLDAGIKIRSTVDFNGKTFKLILGKLS